MSCKNRVRRCMGLAVTAAAVLTYQNSNAANFLWNGINGVSATSNWTDSANWSPTGAPGIADSAIFGVGGTVGDAQTVNNVVDTSKTVSTLNYTNAISGAWHVTQISAPNKLTVTNNFTVGGLNADGSITSVGMIGNGTLEVDAPNFKVGNAESANTSINATLDMSGLSNFVYNAPGGVWVVAGTGGDARAGGSLTLAGASNNVTVGTIVFNAGGGNNSSFHSLIQLNGTNIFNVNLFEVCSNKAQFATVQFLSTAPPEAGLRIRGTNGATDDSSRATIVLGDRNNTGSATTDGEMLLNGHPVDIKAATLTIGQDRSGSSGTSVHNGVGVLQFDTGVVDATAINMGIYTSGNTVSWARGTLTVGANGKLIVGSGGIIAGRLNTVTGTTFAGANLNIYGTAICSNSIVKGTPAATNIVDLSNGKLTMTAGVIGTPDAPIDYLTLATSTLTLPVDTGLTNIAVANFNPADSGTVINISSLPILTGYPTFFPLISYTALANSGSVALGTLPGTFKGYITNDTTANVVYLVVTNGPATSKTDTWTGSTSGTWDTSSFNWTASGPSVAYAENDSVIFDDSSTRTNITFSTTHTPLGMLFNNNSAAYTFNGTGKISGETGLTNSGSGSIALKSSGGDNFSGGIVVNAGTVILDDANSAITGPLTISGGATVQIGNNDANGNILSSIANNGSLIINRADNLTINIPITGSGTLTKLGNGTLTLSNANTYLGDTIVSKGTLALAGNGSIANSGVTVTGATLDLSGVSSGTSVLSVLSLNGATVNLANTNGFVPLTLNNSLAMSGTASTINVTALPGIASYPSTVTLIHANGGIGSYNAVLGTLPTGYAGSIAESPDQTEIVLTLTSGPTGIRPFVLWTGNDVPNLNTNWSDAQNWETPGAPTAGENVIFDGGATVGDALTVDNIVDKNTTVSTLRFTNSVTGQWHVTQIPAGVGLTVSSNLTIGGLSGDALNSLAAMTGGGTLTVGGTTLTIGNNGSSSSATATLDLSGLSNFVYSVPTGTIQMSTGTRSISTFKLANGSNYITATNFNDNTLSTSSSGSGPGNLTLGGGTNIVNVANFNIAFARGSSTVSFPDVTGGLRVRGVGGTDNDRAAMTIGNRNNSGGSGNTLNGNVSVNGHPVDMKLSTLTLGQSGSNPTGTANGNGTLSFDTGIVDVNGIVMAVANGSTVGVQATGTINVGMVGTLVVGANGISLGNKNAASGAATANLNIGGTMVSSGNLVKATAGAIANITVTNGGTLKMLSGVIGTPATPVDNLSLDTATLQLAVNGSAPTTNIVVTTINAANTSTLNIGSVAGITAPTTVSLISYTGNDPYPNLALGSLPAGVSATLVDNQANATIDLNITAVPAPVTTPPSFGKITISGGNITITGTNNVGGSSSFHLLTTTNLAAPVSSWTVLTNGSFGNDGSLNLSIPVNAALSRSFYLLQVP